MTLDAIYRRVGAVAAALLLCLCARAEFSVSMPDAAAGGAGDVVELRVYMTNSEPIAGFQCSVVMPEGMTLAGVTMADDRRYPTTQVSFGAKTGTVLVYDPDGLDAGSGLFMTLSVQVPTEGVSYGDNLVRLTNLIFTLTDLTTVKTDGEALGTINIGTIPVTSIQLSASRLNMRRGDTSALKASLTPSTATEQGVLWGSDDESVAAVDPHGAVTAVGIGRTIVTATTVDGGLTAQCEVVVRGNVSGFAASADPVTVGDEPQFAVSIAMSNEFELRGAQFTLRLPEGFSAVVDSRGAPAVQAGDRVDRSHAAITSYYESASNALNVSLYATDMECGLTGIDGVLLTASLSAAGVEAGVYYITVSDIVYSHYDLRDRIVKGECADFQVKVTVTRSFEDIPVRVDAVGCVPAGPPAWTLDGRRPASGGRAVRIVNGKKVCY